MDGIRTVRSEACVFDLILFTIAIQIEHDPITANTSYSTEAIGNNVIISGMTCELADKGNNYSTVRLFLGKRRARMAFEGWFKR